LGSHSGHWTRRLGIGEARRIAVNFAKLLQSVGCPFGRF